MSSVAPAKTTRPSTISGEGSPDSLPSTPASPKKSTARLTSATPRAPEAVFSADVTRYTSVYVALAGRWMALHSLEDDILRAFPQACTAKPAQVLAALDHREKVVARQLA